MSRSKTTLAPDPVSVTMRDGFEPSVPGGIRGRTYCPKAPKALLSGNVELTTSHIRPIPCAILPQMGRPSGKDMSGHGDRVLDVRCVDPEIGDQCLGEAFHREFRRTVCGVRESKPALDQSRAV